MPVQSHGDGWRARKKHAGQWFRGPVRDSVQVAEEDAKKFEEASAVSLEALQAMQRNLTSVNAADASVVVEKHNTGWRLRWGTGENRRHGPTRKKKAEAEDDARQVSAACGVSTQEAERILEQLLENQNLAVEKRSTGWRLRYGTGQNRRYGPTRPEKATAEEDLRRMSDASGVSLQEVEKVLSQLNTDGRSEADDFPLQLAVEKRSTGWRLRYGTGQNRRYGPTRLEKATAEEDLRRVSDASGVSLQEVEKVFSQLNTDGRSEADDFPLQLAVEKRSTGWRLRYGTGQNRRYGPTRPEKATAEEDLRRVSDAFWRVTARSRKSLFTIEHRREKRSRRFSIAVFAGLPR